MVLFDPSLVLQQVMVVGMIAIGQTLVMLVAALEKAKPGDEEAALSFAGANVTIPHKQAVLPLLDHYTGERPLFDLHGVEDEIQKALARRVDLKSGGYLIIDQTEAMTTIDVNTGGFVGGRSFDDTIFKTNLEAAQVIARQLRLRNLGGIIIIDFIDMDTEEHRNAVLNEFRKALAEAVIDDLVKVGVPKSAIRFDDAHKRIPVPTQTGNLIVDLPGTGEGPHLLPRPLGADCDQRAAVAVEDAHLVGRRRPIHSNEHASFIALH